MIRTLNYTGRKRIARDRISISVIDADKTTAHGDISIDLDGLALPPTASVYLEAYGRAGLRRFTVGEAVGQASASGITLSGIGAPENISFRLVVVEGFPVGRILASADRLKPSGSQAGEARQSILPVETDDLGQLVWRVDFGEDGPTLVLNYAIPEIKHLAVSDARFFLYVYPSVVREVLTHMVFVEGTNDPEDLDSREWQSHWLEFADMLVPSELRPTLDIGKANFDRDSVRSWIDDVVSEFCTRQSSRWQQLQKDLGEAE